MLPGFPHHEPAVMQYFKEEDSIMVYKIKVEDGTRKASSSSSSAGTSTCGTKIQLCNDKN